MKVAVTLSPGNSCPANQLVIGKDFEVKLKFSNPTAVVFTLLSAGVRICLRLS